MAGLDRLVGLEQQFVGRREVRQRTAHRVQAFLDALGDPDLALAGQEFDGAHFAHVHAHRVGGAAELGVDRGQRGGGFLDGLVVGRDRALGEDQGFRIRRLLVDRDAHVIDHVDDIFDLFRIDDLARQMVVDLAVGQEALLLALGDQQLQLRLPLVGDVGGPLVSFAQEEDPLSPEKNSRVG